MPHIWWLVVLQHCRWDFWVRSCTMQAQEVQQDPNPRPPQPASARCCSLQSSWGGWTPADRGISGTPLPRWISLTLTWGNSQAFHLETTNFGWGCFQPLTTLLAEVPLSFFGCDLLSRSLPCRTNLPYSLCCKTHNITVGYVVMIAKRGPVSSSLRIHCALTTFTLSSCTAGSQLLTRGPRPALGMRVLWCSVSWGSCLSSSGTDAMWRQGPSLLMRNLGKLSNLGVAKLKAFEIGTAVGGHRWDNHQLLGCHWYWRLFEFLIGQAVGPSCAEIEALWMLGWLCNAVVRLHAMRCIALSAILAHCACVYSNIACSTNNIVLQGIPCISLWVFFGFKMQNAFWILQA